MNWAFIILNLGNVAIQLLVPPVTVINYFLALFSLALAAWCLSDEIKGK